MRTNVLMSNSFLDCQIHNLEIGGLAVLDRTDYFEDGLIGLETTYDKLNPCGAHETPWDFGRYQSDIDARHQPPDLALVKVIDRGLFQVREQLIADVRSATYIKPLPTQRSTFASSIVFGRNLCRRLAVPLWRSITHKSWGSINSHCSPNRPSGPKPDCTASVSASG